MKVVSAKKQNNKVTVVFDDGNIISLFGDIFLEHKLFNDSEISCDLYFKVIDLNDERIIINFAKKLLAVRLYSVKSLKNKLLKKNDNEKIVDKVISLFKEYGYLNDREFARQFIKDRLINKKKGRLRIKYDLKNEGINTEIIDELLSSIEDDTEIETAYKLAESKLRTAKKQDVLKLKGKIFRFLQSRGFGRSTCSKVLSKLFKNNDEVIYE